MLELACQHKHLQCAKVLLAHKAPLSTKASTLATLSPIVHSMAQTVLQPDVLHQALATEIMALHVPVLQPS